ncbi:hypothetical protein [Parvularcula sp. LCG005]|uniref:hypothetical protein n=1 Tax=Parvularcula sp. LCG005 TaxID=3078805 RepID=UPI00294377D9|nr:hypothetical protein [Parvularcula sp. LCG005]WOI52546.1 hypothetical protein RUI03_10345 [Parvularcula sp. LCG005]
MRKSFVWLTPLALIMSGCTAEEERSKEQTEQMDKVASSCPIMKSRDWQAWVDAVPGAEAQRTLRISGQVDLPTPGYSWSFKEGVADRSATPRQTLMLELTPPDGMVTQVVTTEQIDYSGPALAPSYRAIVITCQGETIAEVTDVSETQ